MDVSGSDRGVGIDEITQKTQHWEGQSQISREDEYLIIRK